MLSLEAGLPAKYCNTRSSQASQLAHTMHAFEKV